MQTMSLAGESIAITDRGSADTAVVFIHGNSLDSGSFAAQLADTTLGQHRLVSFDLPGHGQSPKPSNAETTYSLPGYARIVTDLVDTLELKKVVLVGHSLGGHIALEAAPHLADRGLAGVAIFGTPPLGSLADMGTAFLPHPAGAFLFAPEMTREQAELYAGAMWDGAPPTGIVDGVLATDGQARANVGASVQAGNFADERAIVANLTVPLAVLHAQGDALVNGDYFNDVPMPSLWRGAVQTITPGGHCIQSDNAQAFNGLLGEFLADAWP